jgi:hypothetical protein
VGTIFIPLVENFIIFDQQQVWARPQTHMLCICLGLLSCPRIPQQHEAHHGKGSCQAGLLFPRLTEAFVAYTLTGSNRKERGWEQRSTSPGTLGWKTLFRSKEEALEWVFCGRGGGVGGSSPLFMASSMEVLE